MKIAVIGSGHIGRSLGGWAAELGYDITFTAKNMEHAREAADAAGHGARAVPLHEAVASADMVLLAVPYASAKAVISEVKPLLKGKILIDPTNAVNADYSGLLLGYDTSAAEELAALAPEAKVVKAFNTVFASFFTAKNPQVGGHSLSVLYAGDDAEAKKEVGQLIARLGFDAIDAGSLSVAREIEPMGMLNIRLAFKQGLGAGIGFTLLH